MHAVLPVVESSQPSAVRFAARQLADRAGFTETDSYRTGLVATELATNLVKHAHSGQVLMRLVNNGKGISPAVELLAVDRGPGMPNTHLSLADGHSTSGSSGIGLGAVSRLSDEFDIHSSVPHGTVVFARFRAGRATIPPLQVTVAGMSVCMPGEVVCGDAWGLQNRPDGIVVFMADGLGHGQFAADAATTAVRAFEDHTAESGADVLAAVHDSLRHTRGAAGAIARLDRSKRVVKFTGVGNISAAVISQGSVRQAVSHNGTLGHQAFHFREYTYPWPERATVVMHSDGLSSRWSFDAYPGLLNRHPLLIAAVLYRDFARGRDDVTVVVGREAA